jgi:hypothetical protein
VEIALRHDAKGADCREHPTLRAVELVYTLTVSYRLALTAPRHVQVPREHISRVAIGIGSPLTGAASTAEVAIPSVTIALTVADIVAVPHFQSRPPQIRICHRSRLAEYEHQETVAATNRWLTSSVGVGS